MTPAPLQFGHAPSELALNRAGFTPLALANAGRTGAGATEPTPAPFGTDPWMRELLPDPATPVTTHSTPSGTSTPTSRRLCVSACLISSLPAAPRPDGFSLPRSSRWRPVTVPLARRPATVPS